MLIEFLLKNRHDSAKHICKHGFINLSASNRISYKWHLLLSPWRFGIIGSQNNSTSNSTNCPNWRHIRLWPRSRWVFLIRESNYIFMTCCSPQLEVVTIIFMARQVRSYLYGLRNEPNLQISWFFTSLPLVSLLGPYISIIKTNCKN